MYLGFVFFFYIYFFWPLAYVVLDWSCFIAILLNFCSTFIRLHKLYIDFYMGFIFLFQGYIKLFLFLGVLSILSWFSQAYYVVSFFLI